MYKEPKNMKIGDVGIIFWNANEEYDREGVNADIVYEVVKKISENHCETLLKTRNQEKADSYFNDNHVVLISSLTYEEPKIGILNNEMNKAVNIIGEKKENRGGDICDFYLYNYEGHQASVDNPYVTLKSYIKLV